MSVYRDPKTGGWMFEFARVVHGQRVRTRKRLPKAWTQAQADKFDRDESARLYATATGAGGEHHTIDDAVALYIKHRAPELKNGAGAASELAQIYWAYKGRPLSALPDVAKALLLKRGDLSAATVRNRIAYLRAACRYAWKSHGLGDADPGTRITMPKVSNERHRYIDRAEMLAIARACTNRGTRMVIRIAFYSGMRLSEILKARPVGAVWEIRTTKNGEPRRVPIHPKVAVCARCFKPCPKITIQRAWARARDLLGFEDLHFHDLRHSAASALINSGVDLYTVGRVLGHKDLRSTQRYAHLETTTLATAVGKIGKRA